MKVFSILSLLTLAVSLTAFAQTKDIVQSEGITSPLHQSNIGKITFMAEVIPIEKYNETDFLNSFQLKEKCDLNIRTFMSNSLTNYLHQLSPESTLSELTSNGNYQFSFYVDSSLIYKENLSTGAGGAENKNTKTVFRVPLISSTNEDSWGRFLWNRFMMRGGEDALETGEHILKIEIRPYLKNPDIKIGDLIAQGQLKIVIVKRNVDEKEIAIQKIKPNSGWQLSTANYNKEKIRELNLKIAQNTFKEITSIVVIKGGKLLLEEYFNGSNRDSLNDTRSASKSFASTLTGIAIQEGFIKNENQTLREFYDLKQFGNYSVIKESVTLKNLLTMSSAFEGSDMNQDSKGNEENMYPTNDWVKFTLNLPMDSSKSNGKQWDYFTAGVILLGDVLNKSAPQGLEKYADKKLFQPLGIKNYKWQYTPQKVVNTAGSLQMNSLDYAKFGQLYKNGGTWNGQQIISKKWIDSTFTKHIELSERPNEFYGYLFWNKTFIVNGKQYETYYCSGNGGNSVFIFKDIPLVVVITATAYNKPYGHPQVDKIMERYILQATTEQ
jgi:CubicO group peptidase (beta-lactamase class C family)